MLHQQHTDNSQVQPGVSSSSAWAGRVLGILTLAVASLVAYAKKDLLQHEAERALDPALTALRQPAKIPPLTPTGPAEKVNEIYFDEANDSYVVLHVDGQRTWHPRASTYTQEGDPENPSPGKEFVSATTPSGATVTVLSFAGSILPYPANDELK